MKYLLGYRKFFRKKVISKKHSILKENVQQSLAILKKLKMDKSNPEYKRIRDLLADKHNYVGMFTKFYFQQNISFEDLEKLYNFLLTDLAKSLPKNILKYDSHEELVDDIRKVENEKIVRDIINELPSDLKNSTREELSDDDKNVFVEFSKIKNKKSFFDKVSKIKDHSQLIKLMREYIKKSKRTFDGILELINKRNADLIYSDEKSQIIIAKVNDYTACLRLGSTNWCIVNDASQYHRYTSGRIANQYIIWNFKLDVTDPYRQIGVTVNVGDEISAAHDFNDSDIANKLPEYLNDDLLNLLNGPDEEEVKRLKSEEKERRKIEMANAEEHTRLRLARLREENISKRMNDEWRNDSYVKALIVYLDIENSLEEGEDIYDVLFEIRSYPLRTFEYNGAEYMVGEEEESYDVAREYVENTIDEIGYDGYVEYGVVNPSDYMDGERLADEMVDEYDIREYPDSYDISKTMIESAVSEIEDLREEIEILSSSTSYITTIINQAIKYDIIEEDESDQYFYEDDEELRNDLINKIISKIEEKIEEIEEDQDNYDVDEDEVEAEIESQRQEYINDPYGTLKDRFGDVPKEFIERYIDKDKFAQAVLDYDGLGNTLDRYDGGEYYETIDGIDYYIFRIE